MLDYDLVRVFRPLIISGLSSLGITAKVLQNYQPTKQGIKDNIVYFHNIGEKKIGYQSKSNVWNKDLHIMEGIEFQNVETTFQINTILEQNPSAPTITAKDLLNYVSMILQSRDCIKTLNENGIGILWISEIKNIPFVDGKDNFEYNPTMDIKLTHKHIFKKQTKVVEKYSYQIKRV